MTQWFLQYPRKARVIFVFFFARIRAAAALAYSRCHVLLSCRANIHRSSRSRRRLIRDNTIFLAVAVRDSARTPSALPDQRAIIEGGPDRDTLRDSNLVGNQAVDQLRSPLAHSASIGPTENREPGFVSSPHALLRVSSGT